MRMELCIRFDYGETVPWVTRTDGLLTATAGPNSVALWTRAETHGEDMRTVAEFTVSEGQQIPYVLTWYPSHEPPPRPRSTPGTPSANTEEWWRTWSSACTYKGDYRDAVLRSLITLKALTYEPTGGIVAAATTSLPEALGGTRNWDYRYCWLRDATLTLESLMRGGYHDEAMAWRDWLLRAAAGDVSKLQIMYGASGERRLDEWEVDWLPGYEGSAPVRIGNAAAGQFQLDVYGEVMSALYSASRVDGVQSRAAWDLQVKLMEFLETGWDATRRRDLGGARPSTPLHALQGHGLGGGRPGGADDGGVARPRRTAGRLEGPAGPASTPRCARRGSTTKKQAFTQYYGCDQLDASLLMIPLVGFLPATDPRVVEHGRRRRAGAGGGRVRAALPHRRRRRGRRTDRPGGSLPGLLVLAGRLPAT